MESVLSDFIVLFPFRSTCRTWLKQTYADAVSQLRSVDRHAEPPGHIPETFQRGMNMQQAVLLHDAGRCPEAEELTNRVLKLKTADREAHWLLGLCLQQKGDFQGAEARFRFVLSMAPADSRALAALGFLLGKTGRRQEALTVAGTMNELAQKSRNMPYALAIVYAGLGDRDKAFSALERALEAKDQSIVYLNSSPRLAVLRDDPRFAALARRIGLSQKP